MILVSFYFGEDALSNDVKNISHLLALKVLKSAIPLFWGTPCIVVL